VAFRLPASGYEENNSRIIPGFGNDDSGLCAILIVLEPNFNYNQQRAQDRDKYRQHSYSERSGWQYD
jgi:hypothetical protein